MKSSFWDANLIKVYTHFDHDQTSTKCDDIADHVITLDEQSQCMGDVTEAKQDQKVDDGQDQNDDQSGRPDPMNPLLDSRHPTFDRSRGFQFLA